MTKTVKLNTIEEIQRLNQVATMEDYNLSVNWGYVMVDAKSLLALFSLLGREVSLVAPDGISPKQFQKVVDRMHLTQV